MRLNRKSQDEGSYRLVSILALIFVGIYLPIAFMDAIELQASIDAMQNGMARVARLARAGQ